MRTAIFGTLTGLCAGVAGYAMYKHSGVYLDGVGVTCALESFGFFLLWSAKIVAEVIKVA